MDLSTSFGTETASYEAGRPEYPRESVRWMLAETLPNAQTGEGTAKSLPYVTAAYRTAVTHLSRTRRGSR